MPDDPEIFARVVATKIAIMREAKGMTQQQLADAVCLARTSVVNIEAHKQAVTLQTLWRCAKAFGVDPKKLLP